MCSVHLDGGSQVPFLGATCSLLSQHRPKLGLLTSTWSCWLLLDPGGLMHGLE